MTWCHMSNNSYYRPGNIHCMSVYVALCLFFMQVLVWHTHTVKPSFSNEHQQRSNPSVEYK